MLSGYTVTLVTPTFLYRSKYAYTLNTIIIYFINVLVVLSVTSVTATDKVLIINAVTPFT